MQQLAKYYILVAYINITAGDVINVIERKLAMNKVNPFMDKDLIKVIIGVRGCGKSTLLKQIRDKLKNNGTNDSNIILINFEDPPYQEINSSKEFNGLISKKTKNIEGKTYFLFDEIQNANGWEKSVNGFRAAYDCDIYITGSNSNLLSGELATYLAGRYITIPLYPFSYNEILECHDSASNGMDDFGILAEYIKYGGMPFLYDAGLNNRQKLSYLADAYSSIVLRDIASKHNIKDGCLLNRILLYVFENAGHEFSASKIYKCFKHEGIKVSKNKILNYLSYMENASLVYKAKREQIKGKGVLKFNEKILCC